MPEVDGALRVATLADYVEMNYEVAVHCRCGHCQTLSLPKLIELFGADFEIVKHREAFVRRFVCNRCGERARSATLSPAVSPNM